MKRIVLGFVVASFLIAAVAPAQADVTAWLGRLESDDLYIDGTSVWGGAIGFSFAEYFGLELVVDWARDSELPFNLEDFEDLFAIDLSVDMLFISGNVVLQYPLDQVTPYVTMGYGGFGIRISGDIYDEVAEALSGSTMFTFGFGAKVIVSDVFALRGEWRTYRLDFSDTEGIDIILAQVENPTFSRLAVGGSLVF